MQENCGVHNAEGFSCYHGMYFMTLRVIKFDKNLAFKDCYQQTSREMHGLELIAGRFI